MFKRRPRVQQERGLEKYELRGAEANWKIHAEVLEKCCLLQVELHSRNCVLNELFLLLFVCLMFSASYQKKISSTFSERWSTMKDFFSLVESSLSDQRHIIQKMNEVIQPPLMYLAAHLIINILFYKYMFLFALPNTLFFSRLPSSRLVNREE